MKIREFLRGPLPDDVLQELEVKFGGPLTRVYVVGFKGRYVNPDGKAEEVLSRFGLLAQGGVKPCTAGYDVVKDRWLGPPVPVVRRYVDVASSDAIFVGTPQRCKAAEAKPAVIDIIRLDKDFKAPKFIIKRAGGKVQVIDRASGVVVKEFSENKYSAKAAAKALGVPPGELIEAERWGEDAAVPVDVLEWHMRLAAERAAKRKLDVRFMFSGAKGFHVLFTLERPAPANWRPAIARKLAEWLGVEADPAAFDPARKLRVPWTVHTETGRPAVFVDPKTLEPVEFDWPKPIPYALAKTLAALGMSAGWSPPRPEPKPKPRRGGWVPLLEKIAAANSGLKEDCRKRFSALFGCGCAVDGLDAESCAERLAAALDFGELPSTYRQAMERAFKACAERIAEGKKPLFSVRRALTLDVGEGEGRVWYSIKECIAVLPPAEGQAVPTQRAPPAEEQVSQMPEAETSASNVHNVSNTPMHLTNLEKQTTNIETVPPPNVDASQGQSGLGTLCTLDTNLPPSSKETNSSGLAPKQGLAEVSTEGTSNLQAAPPDSAEACLANPICANRLKLCIWRRLKVPKEEKKAALYAEIERRGDLFAYCLKDALEYAMREAEA